MRKEAASELREWIRPGRPTHQRIIRILTYLANHPNATQYALAKEVYGSGIRYNRNIRSQIHHLSSIPGLIRIRKSGGRTMISLTEGGRILCQEVGVPIPSTRAQRILGALTACLPYPLTKAQIERRIELLTDETLDAVISAIERIIPNELITATPSPEKEPSQLDVDLSTLLVFLTAFSKERSPNIPEEGPIVKYLSSLGLKPKFEQLLEWIQSFKDLRDPFIDLSKWIPCLLHRAAEQSLISPKRENFGPCGLACFTCGYFRILCPGCTSNSLSHYPCRIAQCCLKERNLFSCADCSDFPCPTYLEWSERPGVVHARWSLMKIREIGWDSWLANYPKDFFTTLEEHALQPDPLSQEGVLWGIRRVLLSNRAEVERLIGSWLNSENSNLKRTATSLLNQLLGPMGFRRNSKATAPSETATCSL